MGRAQQKFPTAERDYSGIEYYRKAVENETNPVLKETYLHSLQDVEARRDFYTGTLRPIDHLIQFDNNPNMELNEARWEIYKISISFKYKRKKESPPSRKIFFTIKP